ncbi:helix-turn-helix transcriptional regulator [Acidisphaera sp. S103]|uniref:helix-turn-helix domain-containing protein n=1 Tax=Acidisphaera sp. S103 TaxID=1747223 RepID=UPI001C20210C|nr:helix-turn-helix transcriptional regulator [Acidisphaera sp. S103]
MLITPEQIRAARALLRIDQTSLAQDAGISVVTLRRLEEQHGLSKVAPATVEQVRRALEEAGVEFIDRGVRRGGPTSEDIQAIKQDVDRIVAGSAASMAKHPPLTDGDLYDENGLRRRSSSIPKAVF